MVTPDTSLLRQVDQNTYCDQSKVLKSLIALADLSKDDRQAISENAAALVESIRTTTAPGLMEVFLAEYGLSTEEGVALMCLAEALLRVPDAETISELIEDKIAPSDWGKHLGHSTSSLVNASTWGLLLTGRVLTDAEPGPAGHLRAAIKRLGEPVIRTAVTRAMKEMGRQFVLGEDINAAMHRASQMEKRGYTYSYDMLGEAAHTDADAKRYHLSYSRAIAAIATACTDESIRNNPGISVKLSALHPRYEVAQADTVMTELVPRLRSLALLAKSAGMGLNIDAEEADRLALSLEVIDRVMAEPALAGWHGFGIVVQAYGPRAGSVIDVLYQMAERHDRKIMVRLVKGAYWDTEIKRAQVAGVAGFPVFTQKAATDVSYIANARKLLGMTDRIYPQFATHNAHTVAAILRMAQGQSDFEFQRLHGMGETLHDIVLEKFNTACRIYAPVGAHRDLLAYLVRRLLENGANSSFVNQIVDKSVPAEIVALDPFEALKDTTHDSISTAPDLFQPERANSKGFDLAHAQTLDLIHQSRDQFQDHLWRATPMLATDVTSDTKTETAVQNPAIPQDKPGKVISATAAHVDAAFKVARLWQAPAQERQAVLQRSADFLEERFGEIFALLSREAGKTLPDCVAELREAVDFLRYYATQATEEPAAGVVACISPWNFPLAIFLGQVSAALAAGNAVLAKPAEQTPLIAALAVEILHNAGVPRTALQLLPGNGEVGAQITARSGLGGVAFTGSTATALRIRSALSRHARPGTPLIAETGGLNSMIIDSTALPEQAVEAVIESAFQSAGQRCSALRCLYVQEDIAEEFTRLLVGAMEALNVGNPWNLSTDVGPVIDSDAMAAITDHIAAARGDGRLIAEVEAPTTGNFIAPTLIRVSSIEDLKSEVFGPVLHLATFKAAEINKVIDQVNATGYGLTFGLQTRIDDRVQHISERIEAGNIYVNRNQIGAIVGSQPFGGEGLSGTGPKAGGPNYLRRFIDCNRQSVTASWQERQQDLPPLPAQAAHHILSEQVLPGPTGESNKLSMIPRSALLCMGPGVETAHKQARAVTDLGGVALVCTGSIAPEDLTAGPAYGGVLWWGDDDTGRAVEQALAARDGPIIPLIPGLPDVARVLVERHVCVDTTASGGNAALLSSAS